MQNSKIEWTDKTWNPVTGCTKVSQGCKNCYAEKIYERFNGKGSFKHVIAHEDRLMQPLRWKQPAMVFVNSMSDLFHEDVSFEFIDKVFAIMALAGNHTFQVLTKRPERMVEYFSRTNFRARIMTELNVIADENDKLFDACCEVACLIPYAADPLLKNVWLGVSVEDQKAADERIPLLLQVPAAVRFLSCEPLLGAVDILQHLVNLYFLRSDKVKIVVDWQHIDWVICGGESGSKARPMHPDWARSLRDQCNAAGVPFFFKQWGEWYPIDGGFSVQANIKNGWVIDSEDPLIKNHIMHHGQLKILNQNCARVDMCKLGKKKAGRLLDGKEWNEMPVES